MQSAIKKPPRSIEILKKGRSFRLPHEHGAWWTLAVCLGAGLGLVISQSTHVEAACWLTLSIFAFFMVSDWMSALAGAYQDELLHANLFQWQAWALLAGAGISLIFFFRSMQCGACAPWPVAMVSTGAVAAVMFLLRQDLPARDMRLLLLSSLLLTVPTLFMGALTWGWYSINTWMFWLWPAIFYPSGVLYVKFWMSGNLITGLRVTTAAVPFIFLMVTAAAAGHWLAVVVFAVIAMRGLHRMHRRLRDNPDRIPRIKEIRAFGWEQVFLSVLFAFAWIAAFV